MSDLRSDATITAELRNAHSCLCEETATLEALIKHVSTTKIEYSLNERTDASHIYFGRSWQLKV